MRSFCGYDGEYKLELSFPRGTDPTDAEARVMREVELVRLQPSNTLQCAGLEVTRTARWVAAIVTISPAEGGTTALDPAKGVDHRLLHELSRLPGVSRVERFGRNEHEYHVLADRRLVKLYNATLTSIENALRETKIPVAELVAPPGLNSTGRLPGIEVFLNAEIKDEKNGRSFPLRSLALVQPILTRNSHACRLGKPVIALMVHAQSDARAAEVCQAVRELLERTAPERTDGISTEMSFAFGANLEPDGKPNGQKYLLVEMAMEFTRQTEAVAADLKRFEGTLRGQNEVDDAIVFTEHPFEQPMARPCAIVRLKPNVDGDENLIERVRARLKKDVPDAEVRVRNLSSSGRFPALGFPISLAVKGPRQTTYASLVAQAKKVATPSFKSAA
jgi:multidrug efflux pump subunit AcrB